MMATDGLGVISDDGKTVSYSVGIELTGTGAALDRPCRTLRLGRTAQARINEDRRQPDD